MRQTAHAPRIGHCASLPDPCPSPKREKKISRRSLEISKKLKSTFLVNQSTPHVELKIFQKSKFLRHAADAPRIGHCASLPDRCLSPTREKKISRRPLEILKKLKSTFFVSSSTPPMRGSFLANAFFCEVESAPGFSLGHAWVAGSGGRIWWQDLVAGSGDQFTDQYVFGKLSVNGR